MGRRNVTKNLLEQEITIEDGEIIAKVLEPRGKNLHLIEFPTQGTSESNNPQNQIFEETLCSLPSKFRNMVWIKRGSFVVIQLYDERDGKNANESKVGGVITNVLFPYHIKRLKATGKWPEHYNNAVEESSNEDTDEQSEEELVNPNYRNRYEESSSSEEEE